MKLDNKTILIFILAGVITCLYISRCSNTRSSTEPIRTRVINIDSAYRVKTIKYLKQNDSLNTVLCEAKLKLKESKSTLYSTQGKLYRLIRSTGNNVSNNCDSIKTTTITYITQVDSTLTDYAVKDSIQTALIQIKDQQINMCDSSYNVMAGLSKELIKDLHKAVKRNKRNKTIAKILGTALAISFVIFAAPKFN